MKTPAEPHDERARLARLHDLGVLDTEPEERFDRLTRIASLAFEVPICLVSLVDSDRQWFKSRVGLDATETPRDISFCGHAILHAEPLIVEDALADERFADNPLVCGAPDIRFYAGHPLDDGNGHKLGTLCLIDTVPRAMTAADRTLLAELAGLVARELTSVGLEAAIELVDEERQRMEIITESVLDAIVTIRGDGTVVDFNRAAEQMYGYRREDIIGLNASVLVPADDRAMYAAQLEAHGPGYNLDLPHELMARHRNGSTFPVDLAVTEAEIQGETMFIGRVTDESDRRAAELALRASDALHRSVIAALDEGVLVVRSDGVVEEANARAHEIVGLPDGSVKGHTWASVMELLDCTIIGQNGQELPDRERPMFRTLLYGDTVRGDVIGLRRPGREVLWLSVNTSPIGTGDGSPPSAVFSFEDISKRIEVERMKDEFVSVVSHELRTPLTSIRGSLGLLASGTMGDLDPKVEGMLQIAVNNADRLVRLINDILDIERIQSGVAALNRRAIDIEEIVTDAIAGLRPVADEAGVSLPAPSGGSHVVWADPDRIHQTVTNLLGNAIKFSPEGGSVEVWTAASDHGVVVNVRDRGRGIPRATRSQIFARFSQVDASDSREHGGTGLGLAICKEIVEQHDGRIWVASTLGVGSTFSFTLPRPPEAVMDEAIGSFPDRTRVQELSTN